MLPANLPPFVTNSSLAAVLAMVCSGGSLAALLTFVIRWRGQSIGSEAQLRTDMAEQLSALREQMRQMEAHYRRMLEDSDRRHELCEADRQALRRELEGMHDEIRGLKRQISRYSADKLTELEGRGDPRDVAPNSAAAARRVKKLPDGDKGGGDGRR